MRSFRRKACSQKGEYLPEVIVSCLIGAMAIGGALTTLMSGRLSSTGAKHWVQAVNLASARIEYLKSLRYVDISAMPSVSTETDVALDERDGGNSVRCSRTTSLQPQDGGTTVTVTIAWQEKAAGAGAVPWSFDLKTWVGSPASP